MSNANHEPRPSSVVCTVCMAGIGRACKDALGNTRKPHDTRRDLARVRAAEEPKRRATLASEARATIRLGNAVVDAIRVGVAESTIRLIFEHSLTDMRRATALASKSQGEP